MKCTFVSCKYSDYFEFVVINGKNIRVQCQLCGDTRRFSSVKNSTSSLLEHLNGGHSTVKHEENLSDAESDATTSPVSSRASIWRTQISKYCGEWWDIHSSVSVLLYNSVSMEKQNCYLELYNIELIITH